LARRTQEAAAQDDGEGDDVLVPLDRQPHSLVVDVDEAGQRLQRVADRCLLAHDQRHRAEIGKRAAISQQQADFLDAGIGGGSLEQAANRGDRYPHVRTVKALQRQADLAQHDAWVEPDGARDIRIVREGCAAYQYCHGGYASGCPQM
jgi:hypothetical protein